MGVTVMVAGQPEQLAELISVNTCADRQSAAPAEKLLRYIANVPLTNVKS